MNAPAEKTIAPGTQLCHIYKTDPFGFPLYPSDEKQYSASKQGQGVNPNAISETPKANPDNGEQSEIYESVLNI
jgi:hypothetical protein